MSVKENMCLDIWDLKLLTIPGSCDEEQDLCTLARGGWGRYCGVFCLLVPVPSTCHRNKLWSWSAYREQLYYCLFGRFYPWLVSLDAFGHVASWQQDTKLTNSTSLKIFLFIRYILCILFVHLLTLPRFPPPYPLHFIFFLFLKILKPS